MLRQPALPALLVALVISSAAWLPGSDLEAVNRMIALPYWASLKRVAPSA
jgi:hypothetical protein